jgi:hypothetical protein
MSCMHKTFHCQKFPNCFIAVHVYSVIISDACCRGQHKQSLGDAFWDAWACVCSSGTHLKEKTQEERTIGILLAFGGLLFYSLLTSTMTAQIKVWSFFPLSFTFCNHCPHNHAYISSAFFMEHIVQMIAAVLKPT